MADQQLALCLEYYASPIGKLRIGTAGQSLCVVSLGPSLHDDHYIGRHFGRHGVSWGSCPRDVHSAFDRYFDGDFNAFDDLEVELKGTSFQQRVWAALRTVPAGRTCSYRDIATQIGNPAAVRAVGRANGQNPIAIVVPCHRIIGSNGALVGYGGGLGNKKWLLEHERSLPQRNFDNF